MKSLKKLIKKQLGLKNGQDYAIGVPDDHADYVFSDCDITGITGNVVEVDYVIYLNKNGNFSEVAAGKIEVLHEVLDCFHNGTDYLIDEDNLSLIVA
jgi:hypothetical protein